MNGIAYPVVREGDDEIAQLRAGAAVGEDQLRFDGPGGTLD